MQHLTKKADVGKLLLPTNDIFYEIDISAYHPSLSCRLIDYNFPSSGYSSIIWRNFMG